MTHRTVRRLSFCFALILILCLGRVHAANIVLPPQPEPPPFIPVLRVRGAERPVRLQSLAIQAAVQGGFAEIALDMLFHNPNARVLEGELQFPLLPGQEISGLALDVQGEMRPGVPVPKARGQEIFDAIARRNVDPALLEATRGDNYKLRLYPIPAKGTRRVVVRILQPLAERDGMFTLRLPLAFAKHLDTLSVEALIAAAEPPRVESGALGLVLEKAGLLYRGRVEKKDISPEGWLTLAVPASAAPGDGVNAVRWRDKIYFTASVSVEARTAKRVLPKLAAIVWDASGSGLDRDHAREYALLDAYFAALGDGTARLVVVRNAAEAPRDFAIRRGDWSELKSYLHKLSYDGGTDLLSWRPTPDCAEYLLFSDGLANFGGSLGDAVLPAMLPEQRLYAVASSTGADRNALRHASRGRLIDLTRCDDAAAARLLLEDGATVRIAPGELAGKGEALLEAPAIASEKGASRLRCRLAGWLKARSENKRETIALRLEHPDGGVETLSLDLPPDADVPDHAGDDAPLAARLWGRYAIAGMEANPRRHRAAIRRLGAELGIVSRETSLIVLETAEDYARYDVTPPASLRAEVERLRADGGAPADEIAYLPPERLERMWAEKVAWWEKDYSKTPARKKDSRPEPAMAGEEARYGMFESGIPGDRADMAMEAPAALPPPSAALARPMAASGLARQAEAVSTAAPEAPRAAIGIALQAWKSDAPYIRRMDKANAEDMYAIYLDERPSYARSGAFYLDMADRFFAAGLAELALRVLSNLAEIDLENRRLLRVLAYRLLEAEEAGLALGVLEAVRELAPYEPQSLRDLAHAHRALGNLAEAADLLYEVARREWDERFSDINVIALTELNALVATSDGKVDAAEFDSRLVKNLDSDLRVVLTWDADNTDMDLWVTDPDGEKCSYENRLTRRGGAISRDCTGGYGPEEFMLRRAKPGVYRVEVEYYGNSQQALTGDVTLYVALATAFGRPESAEQVVTMRLKHEKNRVLVGEFTVR